MPTPLGSHLRSVSALLAAVVLAACVAPEEDPGQSELALETPLIAAGATWRYYDGGNNQGTAWRATSFDDSAWASGPARLGYGGDGEVTTVSYGARADRKHITTYFRRAFTVANPAAYTALTLSIARDDGAVVYLDDTEVFRTNLPAGTITRTTLASVAVAGADEQTFITTAVPISRLASGTNVVAVEIHQAAIDSSDLGFDLSLTATSACSCPDDGNPCTDDFCDAASSCTHPADDTNACGGGTCGGGVCQGAPLAVLVGAGDIAGSWTTDSATAQLLTSVIASATAPVTVFTTGDNVYNSGTAAEFATYYAPTWGVPAILSRTRPAPGNHDYRTVGATGYFGYFGAAATGSPAAPEPGYYTYTLASGTWRVFALNSCGEGSDAAGQCTTARGDFVGAAAGSRQETWLRNQLAANTSPCILAYWHHPVHSSHQHGNSVWMNAIYQALYDHGADIVLEGHEHAYERFAPQTVAGAADEAWGLRDFVVGTGGSAPLHAVGTIQPNSVVRDDATSGDSHGVLELTLSDGSYRWSFLPVAGKTFTDSGSARCHLGAPPPVTTLIATGATWKYLANGSNQATAWRAIAFDDGAWPAGAARLGYGGDGEVTTVGYGPDANNKYVTTYFRRAITVTNPAAYSTLTLALARDDGAVAYLNGTEVFRTNLPAGTIASTTLASVALGGADEQTPVSASLPATGLVSGVNVVAVEIHQAAVNSSDIGFNLSLTAR